MRTDRIEVVTYNPNWVILFEQEAKALCNILSDERVVIHHIGSTSVPQLAAKPIIDIMCVVNDINKHDYAFERIGYQVKGELGIPFRHFFSKDIYHVHMFEADNPDIKLHLTFRDILRNCKSLRDKYQSIKLQLAQDPTSYEKDANGYKNYTLNKDSIIKEILDTANLDDRYFRQCLHHNDWTQYHKIKDEQIFQPIDIIYDSQHPSLTADHHMHFVLYYKTQVASIAHIEFLSNTQVALRALAADKHQQNKGHGKYLLNTLHKWLKSKGYKTIITHARLTAEVFYRNLGYTDMPFNDPSINPTNCIDLGKVL